MAHSIVSGGPGKGTVMCTPQDYEANRQRTLAIHSSQHEGKWVALNADGSAIVDSHRNLGILLEHLEDSGIALPDVNLERLVHEDIILGEAELH